MAENLGEIIIYQTEDGLTNINVKMEDETVWLTQQQLVDLYQSSKSNVSEHIKHIFEEGELNEESVVRKFRTTAADGKSYNMTYYNLDMIISLGYRIKTGIATHFRRWATERLKEYLIKGFTMDDDRLKGNGGGNYWKELLDRIRPVFQDCSEQIAFCGTRSYGSGSNLRKGKCREAIHGTEFFCRRTTGIKGHRCCKELS